MTTLACKSCGAAVIWAVTENGKAMPVDTNLADDGTIELVEVRAGGEVLARVVPEAERPERRGALHRSHFSTCPDARAWRKPR